MRLSTSVEERGLTRRALLRRGGAATVAALVTRGAWAPAPARASAAGIPHLRRSSYTTLKSRDFAVAGGLGPSLRLTRVSDLPGGGAQPDLKGRDDAFSLAFAGPLGEQLAPGTHALRHPDLGRFELFLSPVGAPGSDQEYEAVVNRAVGVPRAVPGPPKPRAKPHHRHHPARHHHHHHAAHVVRQAGVRRLARGVLCELVLTPSASVRHVHVWLKQDGRTVASARHDVHGAHAKIPLHPGHSLPRGRYELIVRSSDAASAPSSEQHKVVLR